MRAPYVRRDLGYIENLIENNGVTLSASDAELLDILMTVSLSIMLDSYPFFININVISINDQFRHIRTSRKLIHNFKVDDSAYKI